MNVLTFSSHSFIFSSRAYVFFCVVDTPLANLIKIARNTSPENKFLFNVNFFQVRKHLPLEGIFDSDDIMREFSVIPSSGTVTNFKPWNWYIINWIICTIRNVSKINTTLTEPSLLFNLCISEYIYLYDRTKRLASMSAAKYECRTSLALNCNMLSIFFPEGTSPKKAKRENAMHEKKIFNICKYCIWSQGTIFVHNCYMPRAHDTNCFI